MLEIQFRTPEIKEASNKGDRLLLTANINAPVNLFQAQSLSVKTGVAIKSDQLVFAVPTTENNKIGLIPGSGVELLHCEGEEAEILLYNRNVPGQPRMIVIEPGMVLAEIVVMPRYNLEKKPDAPGSTGSDNSKPGAKSEDSESPPSIDKRPEDMSNSELKEALDKAKVAYKAKDTAPTLIKLVHGAYTGGG